MNVGIFYSREPKGSNFNEGYLYNQHPQWRNYPHELLAAMNKLSNKAVIVCKQQTYSGNNTFSSYWVPSQYEKGLFKKVEEEITLDALFNKGYFTGEATFSIVNITKMRDIGRNKARQFSLFSEFQPVTKVATTIELPQIIMSMPSDMVVVKPLNLNGGKGIVIAKKQEVIMRFKRQLSNDQWIVQQFIDSSQGIAGLQSGIHDLRVYMINSEPVLGSVRTPKSGSLVANTSQGGTITFYSTHQLPSDVLINSQKIDTYFEQFGNRYYSIDFINDGKKWYMLEINDRPGVPAEYQSKYIAEFHKKLAQCIVESVDNPLNKVGMR